MLKVFLVRLVLCAMCLGGAWGMAELAVAHPSRSRNTGLPDSGIFGWIGAVFLVGAICSLIIPSSEITGKKDK